MPDLGGVATRVCVGVGIGNPKELALRGGDVDRGRRISAGGDAGEWRFVDSFPSTGGGPARELRFSSAKTSDSSIKSVSVLNTIRATPLSAASVTPAALIQTNLRNHDCRSGSQVADSSRVATPNLDRICETWYFAPAMLMSSRRAISSLVRPSLRRSRTSRSRGVRSSARLRFQMAALLCHLFGRDSLVSSYANLTQDSLAS